MLHIDAKKPDFPFPKIIKTLHGTTDTVYIDSHKQARKVRLLAWVAGRLWSSVNPQLDDLRYSLGEKCGEITHVLADFKHSFAQRAFEWDIAQAQWTYDHLHLFNTEQKACLTYFTTQFEGFKKQYHALRKSVIHNDANDNNIVVSGDLATPSVLAVIDYGDAIYSQTINDIAVTLAYAIMEHPDPLAAALPLVAGYHQKYPLQAEELALLYTLVAMRLVISLTKSGINKIKEPDNEYLLISEKPAWELLFKWKNIPPPYAHYSFRAACGYTPHPQQNAFEDWAKAQPFSLNDLFPTRPFSAVQPIDLSVGSLLLGNYGEYMNIHTTTAKINQYQAEHPDAIIAGGYLEPRPFYATKAFETEGNSGYEYRTIHLGVDFWGKEETAVHALLDGEVVGCAYNGAVQDYGGVIILKHTIKNTEGVAILHMDIVVASEGRLKSPAIDIDHKNPSIGGDFNSPSDMKTNARMPFLDICGIADEGSKSASKPLIFYTLYGHLSKKSLEGVSIGKKIKKGKRIATLGNISENGYWTPHLHFQIMLDLLGYDNDFPGVGLPSTLNVWSSICPDPNLLFKNAHLITELSKTHEELLVFRKKHLGKSLSISYKKPLKILRGYRQYLLDDLGRRYLDTVNNVAHVGHEHPEVVKAGQQQMAVLNTNTRYLHDNILDFAKELCTTLPPELSVIHFVNSGSEANELALRMAQAVTHQKDIIALEIGYHGNTTGCIAVSSYKFDGKGGKGKPEHTHIVPLPDSFRGKYQGDKSETGALYAAHVQEAISDIQKKGRDVAAFLAESIVSCGGQIDLPDNYLKLAYDYVRKAGGVCIADEVQVGFGRVGKHFWGFELQGVVPDIVTMGKPIGNGHPLAAVACTEAVAIAFANGMEYFNTFGGNPVSAAIGISVLKVIKAEKLQENAYTVGEYLKSELRKLQKDFPLIGDVRGEGLFLGFELVEKGKVPATDKTAYLANRMKDHGILISVDGPQNNVIKIKPPMCFDIDNAKDMIRYLGKIFREDYM